MSRGALVVDLARVRRADALLDLARALGHDPHRAAAALGADPERAARRALERPNVNEAQAERALDGALDRAVAALAVGEPRQIAEALAELIPLAVAVEAAAAARAYPDPPRRRWRLVEDQDHA